MEINLNDLDRILEREKIQRLKRASQSVHRASIATATKGLAGTLLALLVLVPIVLVPGFAVLHGVPGALTGISSDRTYIGPGIGPVLVLIGGCALGLLPESGAR
jgi:hypothetical protein